MKTLHRPDSARWHRQDDWKTSAYAFVPYQTHFGELCGFADDIVAPGHGFGLHPHRDMEISTVILSGAQRHEDTTGGRVVLDSHGVQTMSAGTGLLHSEMNASTEEPFHSLQIWIYPRAPGGAPRHERFAWEPRERADQFVLAVSPDRRDGSALTGQDAFLSLAACSPGRSIPYALHGAGNGAYVHCAEGEARVAGVTLRAGDAVGVTEAEEFLAEAGPAGARLVVVEVPMARGIKV